MQQLTDILASSQRLVVITGAGCSTRSGISDYRDANGDWKRVAPVQHQDFMQSITWRQRYWARSQLGYPEFCRARPNPAHRVLAQWESQGRLVGLITQNVDRLHQGAGHQQVLDLHGRLDQVVCMNCGQVSSRDLLQAHLEAHNPNFKPTIVSLAPDGDADLAQTDYSHIDVPNCRRCAGILKPNVVFYGDSVPKDIVAKAYRWVEAADAMLIVGSSLMVYSSYRFVRQAQQLGLNIVAINRGITRADEWLSAKADGDCAEILSALQLD